MMIFDWINFLIRIAIVIYVLKRYVLGHLIHAIAQEKESLRLIKEREHDLKTSYKKVQKHMQHDKEYFEQLEEKFKVWNHKNATFQVKQAAWCQIQQKKIALNAEHKMKFLKRQEMIAQEIPLILDQATVQLQKKFEDEKSLCQNYQARLARLLDT